MNKIQVKQIETKQDKKKEFRLNSKKLFLTYPNVGDTSITKEQILEQLQQKVGSIKNYIIAKELHENGVPHFHVLLELTKRIDIKNIQKLDLDFNDKIYHGNYQSCKNLDSTIKYCSKCIDFITNYELDKTGKKMTIKTKIFNLAIDKD